MQPVDSKAYFQSSVTKTYYKNLDEIPTGDTFSKAFATKQDYQRDDPPLVTIFLTVLCNLRVNTIKYDDRVFNYIGHHTCYIRPDHFYGNNVVSLGMVFGVHPTLVCIKDYKTEVKNTIFRWPASQNDIVHEWVIKHIYTDTNAKVPEFKIVTVPVKWEEGAGKIKTTVFKFLCKEEDCLYFKSLLASTYSHGDKPHGMFIPSKARLVTFPKEYKASLRCLNLYVKDIMLITIEDLHPTALDHKLKVSDKNNRNARMATEFLEREIQELYQQIVPSVLQFEHIPTPRMTNNRNQKALGSYAGALRGFNIPQEEMDND
eukprot:9450165-Ditylum_brightwellii.AAC.1